MNGIVASVSDKINSRDHTFVASNVARDRESMDYGLENSYILNNGSDRTFFHYRVVIPTAAGHSRNVSHQVLPELPSAVLYAWEGIRNARGRIGYRPLTSFPGDIQSQKTWLRQDTAS